MKTTLAVAGTVLFGALLLGAPDAAAAPPPVNPTDIRVPIADPRPQPPTRQPRPDVADPPSDVAVADPCTEDCAPSDPSEEPSAQPEQPQAEPPVDEPAAPPSPKATPVDQPRSIPVGIPTPSRIDTGEGPANPVNWWLIGLPALALLGIAAGGGYFWIRLGERRGR